jgi:hypothetical protein
VKARAAGGCTADSLGFAVAPRDPKQRPTAREALKHPWLHGGSTADRGEGAPLDKTVVQRLQVPPKP